jgi:hypothetical protein
MAGPTGGPPPDIIVVVEVYSRIREVGLEGSVLRSSGAAGQGVLQLLNRIQNAMGDHWAVVPPLNLGANGQREAVAVFYDTRNLQFTGPNLWYDRFPDDPSNIGQAQPVNAETFEHIINYPPAWKMAMPNPNNPNVTLRLNRRTNFTIDGVATPINEWQLAGQWEYYTGDRPIPSPIPPPYPRNRICFPAQASRGPFWTQFNDLTVMNGRTINLFTVHTSPSSARAGVRYMGDVTEMGDQVFDEEMNVILGDFNIDSYSDKADAYGWMIAGDGEYTMQLDARQNHAGATVAARKPYLMTHLLPVNTATPYNSVNEGPDPTHNVYPRFGYMGSAFPNLNNSGAIDNVFTVYGGAAHGPARNITVVNPIVGTPYNRLPAPAGVTAELTGGLPYASVLRNPIPQVAPNGGVDAPPDPIAFSNWQNFAGIYSTSDHLPLMIDI